MVLLVLALLSEAVELIKSQQLSRKETENRRTGSENRSRSAVDRKAAGKVRNYYQQLNNIKYSE